jgi:CheY-like chemotaxis protein
VRRIESPTGELNLTFRPSRPRSAPELARVVHDLRTPLAALVSAAERLREPGLDLAAVATEANTIARAGRGLLGQVEEILGGGNVDPISVVATGRWDPRAVAHEVVELLAPTARAKGLDLRLVDAGSSGSRSGDATPFRRILTNLVGNAVKFSGRGSVVVTLGSHRGSLVASVRDDGPGLEPDSLDTLFDPGVRGAAATGVEGHGLGLANVRDLVASLGGTITVDSRPGDGATFIIRLPEVVAAPRLDAMRVLLVEDCPDNRRLLHHHLRAAGVEVLLASDGLIAESIARAARLDLILLDLAMPGRDGIETLRALRSCGVNAPAIALTASIDAATAEKSLEAGFVRVLTKPVDPSTLRRELRAACSGRAAA